jgi:hypothetical protein
MAYRDAIPVGEEKAVPAADGPAKEEHGPHGRYGHGRGRVAPWSVNGELFLKELKTR